MTAQPQTALLKLRLIWAALLFSLVLYGGVLIQIISTQSDPAGPAEFNKNTVVILGFMAVVSLAVGVFLPRHMLREAKKQKPEIFRSPSPQSLPIELQTDVSTCMIIRYAFLESIALYGFSLGFLSKDPNYFFIFASVTVVGFLLNYPSDGKLRDFIQD